MNEHFLMEVEITDISWVYHVERIVLTALLQYHVERIVLTALLQELYLSDNMMSSLRRFERHIDF